MITFKLNNEKIQVPTTWEEVTYGQYMNIMGLSDDIIRLISIVTGKDYELLKSATISGLDKLIEALSFINTPPEFPGYVSECGPYKLLSNKEGQFNIQYESLGQFEDARQAINKIEPGPINLARGYSKIVSIYLQKIRDGKYTPSEVASMEEEIKNYPAYQVITLGGFFFLKLRSLLNGTHKTYPPIPQTQKKLKQDSTGSKRNSVHTRK